MAQPHYDAVIVGAGHAGAQAAIALRKHGFAGSVVIIGREPEAPYERPPLSKDYLSGDKAFDRMQIGAALSWIQRDIDLVLGTSITTIAPDTRELTMSHGGKVSYGVLIWAAGGEPRRLPVPGADFLNVIPIRTRAHSDQILRAIEQGARKVVVIGGGFIGLEAAATLRKLDCQVTLVEALPRLLARVSGDDLSLFFEEEHRSHGVDVRLNAQVTAIEGKDGSATCVTLGDGEILACDLIIVGIGIQPEIGPLVAAGAAASNGVEVDAFCQTSIAGIYAIGDCAAHRNEFAADELIRLECVQNANGMANVAAKHICGQPEPYHEVPWFWSNQYDLKMQSVGLCTGHDAAIVRGEPRSRSFSVIYLRKGRVVALDCINSMKDYVQGRKLVEGRVEANPAILADTQRPLSRLTAPAKAPE